jgi:predicted phage baseplate assembly protein
LSSQLLCKLPPAPPKGCCDAPEKPPAAPVTPSNPPGLAAIQYRIGTFTTFRRAMLDAVPLVSVPADTRFTPAQPRQNPFAKWHEGMAGDYHTLLIELWAYLADILTFYQERIANEAYLATATQRDSLRRLAELIAYQPQPGSAATALLAFTIEKDKKVTIPAGFRTGSKAKPGKQAAVFETDAGIAAISQHSAIPLSMVAPTNQFAALRDYGLLLGVDATSNLALAASNIYGLAGAAYLETFTFDPTVVRAEALTPELALTSDIAFTTEASRSSGISEVAPAESLLPAALTEQPESLSGSRVISSAVAVSPASASLRVVDRGLTRGLYLSSNQRRVVLRGTSTRLAVGDYVLVVENERAAGEKATPRQLSTVTTDKKSATTTITWREEADVSYTNVTLYALRVTAAPFGNNAPLFSSLPAALQSGDSWDDEAKARAYVPSANILFLDSTYDKAKGTADNPSWAVLLSDKAATPFHVVEARPASKADYVISAKVTRLKLTESIPAPLPDKTFPLRTTVILTGSELLPLENDLPLPDPLSGAKLILAGLYPQLTVGQTVILQGTLFDTTTGSPTEVVSAEAAILAEPPVVNEADNITTVMLKKALENNYARAGAVLFANVVEATQGETVRDEVLGSGNGGAFQTFKLKKQPLTYLPANDSEGLSAVTSTLLVTVNGVRWQEQRTLFESTPDGQDFTAVQDDDEKTSVIFGDGVNGARPPTGRDNIHARYRKGLGTSGNVEAGGIQQLIDNMPGVQKVANPQTAFGGADREDMTQIRTNASTSLRTFGRAVGTADYAALALSYPGVAKASASWVTRDPVTLKALAHPYIQLIIATADEQPLAAQPTFALKLRSFLDQRRDPNVPLRVTDFIPVYIEVNATIEIDDRFPRHATISKAQAALNPGVNPDNTIGFFAFERLGFGESIHLSAVYAALQAVAGVKDARITTLRRRDTDTDPTKVRDSIFIRPTELAIIRNDPNRPNEGTVSVTGTGGFTDT